MKHIEPVLVQLRVLIKRTSGTQWPRNRDTQSLWLELLICITLVGGRLDIYQMLLCGTKKAAEAGDTYSQYMLSLMYILGRGVTEDLAESVRWDSTASKK